MADRCRQAGPGASSSGASDGAIITTGNIVMILRRRDHDRPNFGGIEKKTPAAPVNLTLVDSTVFLCRGSIRDDDHM